MAPRTRYGSADSGIMRWLLARIFIGIPWILISLFIITPVLLAVSSLYMIFHFLMMAVKGREIRITRTTYGKKIFLLWRWNGNNLRWAVAGNDTGFFPIPQ